MSLVAHNFALGQVWGLADGRKVYICAVDDDRLDDKGKPIEAGKVLVADQAPFPGKGYTGMAYDPLYLQTVFDHFGFTLAPELWTVEFQKQEAAQIAALPAVTPAEPVAFAGLGLHRE